MKKYLVIFICFYLLYNISGCGVYYYQEGKTLEQAQQDLGNTYSHFLEGPPLFWKNAEEKGYKPLHKNELPEGIRTRQIDLFGVIYLAGK